MTGWRLTDAQKFLPQVVEKAFSEGPQTIRATKGRNVIVTAVPSERKRRVLKYRRLSELFSKAPLAQIIPPRSKEPIQSRSAFE
jgi:hypothetical protein